MILPRSLVFLTYALHLLFGVGVVLSGSVGPHAPGSIIHSMSDWGAAIVVAAASGIITMRFLRNVPLLEALASLVLFSLLSVYIVSAWGELLGGDPDALRRAALILLASCLPLFRTMELVNVWISHRGEGKARG